MSHHAWMQQAESDLEASKLLGKESCHSQAVWLAAQAVEKGIKAILAALGLHYEEKHYKSLGHKTGEILKLLPDELQEPRDPEIAALVTSLEQRAERSRYPASQSAASGERMIAPAVRFTDSSKDIKDAQMFLGWCRERIQRALRATAAMKPEN